MVLSHTAGSEEKRGHNYDSHRTITKCVKFNSVILALPVLHELLCKLNSIGGTNDRNDPLHSARLGVIDGDVTGGLGSGVTGAGKGGGQQAKSRSFSLIDPTGNLISRLGVTIPVPGTEW